MRQHKAVMTAAESYAYVTAKAKEFGMTPAAFVESVGIARSRLNAWKTGREGMGRNTKRMIDKAGGPMNEERQRVLHILCSPWDGRVSL